MTCPKCKGRKTVIVKVAALGGIHAEVKCPDCKGTGKIGEPGACPECNGSQTVIRDMGGFSAEVRCPTCSAPVVLEPEEASS